jgi:cyclopropane fatty-acyl-phospholipid synthase-like methyltransferase
MINAKKIKKEFLTALLNKNIKKVLDLGCGKGLMSKFFAGKKVNVIGIDLKRTSEDSENFNFIEGDVRKEDFGKKNDLIIASLILHFFKREEAKQIIEKMKKATSDSGYNLLICMSNKDELAKGRLGKFYPYVKELKNIYKNWSLVKELEGITEVEDHDNLGPHQHQLIFLLFQNKKESNLMSTL